MNDIPQMLFAVQTSVLNEWLTGRDLKGIMTVTIRFKDK